MRSYKRLLLSVATLPTITESHEDLSQSLEEYINSIKELAQPPMGKHAGSTSTSRTASRALQPRRASLGLDEVTLRFNSQMDRGSKDPLDWLFDLRRTVSISAHFHFHRSGTASHHIIP
uniref:Uncharacterized protein n=1 Tax=Sinocyclocheilus grahami TaxID=75366 RepID=A0A672Q9Q3_SINGR